MNYVADAGMSMMVLATNETYIDRYKLPGVCAPLVADDIANKKYVDDNATKNSMGDIEYILKNNFNRNLKYDTASRSTTGDLATLTAGVGKDMYLIFAQINVTRTALIDSYQTGSVALSVNDVTEGFAVYAVAGSASSNSSDGTAQIFMQYKFPIGFKVSAGQTIRLRVTNAGASLDVSSEIQCIEVNEGESP